jgi:hypothetical protein
MEGLTAVSKVWLKKEDGGLVLRTITVKDSIVTTSETVFPPGTTAPIPIGTQVYPYNAAVPTVVTPIPPPPATVPPPYHRKNGLEQFDGANVSTRLFLMFACLGVLFLVGLLIWWVIIYPILYLTGLIDRVGEWDDSEKDEEEDDEKDASAARIFRQIGFMYYAFPLVVGLLFGF